MKKLSLLLSLLAFSPLPLFADDFKTFTAALSDSAAAYIPPADFANVPAKENGDVLYQYALKHKREKLEIRYSLYPMKEKMAAYKESKKAGSKTVLTDPNAGFGMFTLCIAMNIAQSDQVNQPQMFDPRAVKEEFNADEGCYIPVRCNSEYGKGYTYAFIVGLHKKDVGMAYLVYLFDDGDKVLKLINENYHTLRFK